MKMFIDPLSIERIKLLHPSRRIKAHTWLTTCSMRNIGVRITSTLRTFKEQDELYKIGRSKPGRIVTNAKAGQSWHNYGFAFDFCLLRGDKSVSWDMFEDLDKDGIADWQEAVDVAKNTGWEWGGDWSSEFRDYPHFQLIGDLTLSHVRYKYEKGLKDKNGYIYLT